MAKDSGPSTALLVTLAAAGLLANAYGKPAERAVAGDGKAGVGGSTAGQDATGPSHIPAAGWWTVAKRVFSGFNDDRLMTEAAGMTFYVLLSIFPALATLISLYGLVADPASVNGQLNAMQGVLPSGGFDIIAEQVKSLTSNGKQALGFGLVVGVLTSLWTANQGMKGLFDALNVVYHEKEKRSFILRTVITLGFTFGALLFVLLAMAAVVVAPIVLGFVGFGDWGTMLLAAARWPVLMLLLALFLAVVYRFGPSRRQARWQWVSWGSGFAAITWLIASIGFSYYVSNFGSYNKTYGSLGAAIGFMTWIWISSMIVLLGGELNAELEQQTHVDSTVGPPKPIGERGAYKADVKL